MTENWLENKTFDEIAVGDSAHTLRRLTQRDIELFAIVSGDLNPAHIDESYARDDRFHGLIAHGLLGGALISAVLGTKLPGPGAIYLSQGLKFLKPVRPGDTIDVSVTVRSKDAAKKTVVFDCLCVNQKKESVITGTAEVIAPSEKIRRPATELPNVELSQHDRLRQLIEKAKRLPPLRTAVAHPCDDVSLQGADAAASEGIIVPVLVGPEAKIRAAAKAAGISLEKYEILDAPHSHAAAALAVALAHDGKVDAVMKGSLHTDELMSAAVDREHGLRTDRRMSHVFVMDVPSYKWPLLITDAALNIAPTLAEKRDICQNAINLAHDLGLSMPKLALLAATEEVSADMPATIDAAALCKMAERGEITGGLLDGPLAFDNAINAEAARIKGIASPVAGCADILVVPNIEAGNMLAKELDYLAAAESAGLVLGARVPIVLTSRADHAHARLASAALAVLSAAGEKTRLDAKCLTEKA
jgi:phosphotransacetylase/acyl dehydratase